MALPRYYNLNNMESPDLMALPKGVRKLALREAAKLVKGRVKERARGRFKKKLSYSVNVNQGEAKIRSKDPLAHLFEFGVEPHVIEADRWPVLVFWAHGQQIVTKSVYHPGMAAQPFMGPAITDSVPDVEKIMHDAAIDTMGAI